jgi:hypothetical protein
MHDEDMHTDERRNIAWPAGKGDMHTPLRIGDRVENAVYGSGTVEGFGYKPGCGEHVCVLWDADPLTVATIYRYRLQRVRGNVGGAVQVGQA